MWAPGSRKNRNSPAGFTTSSTSVPHIMIITPHQDELQSMNRDGSTGMPYVAHLPNQTDVFLVMPIREWSDK